MRVLPPVVRRGIIRFCREHFASGAIRRRVDLPPQPWAVSVHMVLSHGMLGMGMLALRSFEFHTGHAWAPVIHDDGSLTDDDVLELGRNFPDAWVIRRQEADIALAEALHPYPACRENRMKHNWFLKVFDTHHYARAERYLVIDSDIVFFRRPDFLLRWIQGDEETFWFMEDTREKYACPRRDVEEAMGFRVWEKVNSGLDLMVRRGVDLGLAEKFLCTLAGRANEYQFLEQTFFAVTGSAWGRGGLLPREYEISWTNFRRRGAVCRHYVGPFKNDALFVEGATSFWWQSLRARWG